MGYQIGCFYFDVITTLFLYRSMQSPLTKGHVTVINQLNRGLDYKVTFHNGVPVIMYY